MSEWWSRVLHAAEEEAPRPPAGVSNHGPSSCLGPQQGARPPLRHRSAAVASPRVLPAAVLLGCAAVAVLCGFWGLWKNVLAPPAPPPR